MERWPEQCQGDPESRPRGAMGFRWLYAAVTVQVFRIYSGVLQGRDLRPSKSEGGAAVIQSYFVHVDVQYLVSGISVDGVSIGLFLLDR